jgi:hypothetical protein
VYIMSGQVLLPQLFWVLTNAYWYTSATNFRTLATPCSQKRSHEVTCKTTTQNPQPETQTKAHQYNYIHRHLKPKFKGTGDKQNLQQGGTSHQPCSSPEESVTNWLQKVLTRRSHKRLCPVTGAWHGTGLPGTVSLLTQLDYSP